MSKATLRSRVDRLNIPGTVTHPKGDGGKATGGDRGGNGGMEATGGGDGGNFPCTPGLRVPVATIPAVT